MFLLSKNLVRKNVTREKWRKKISKLNDSLIKVRVLQTNQKSVQSNGSSVSKRKDLESKI